MDLYNLEIISFSISPTPSAESILSAQQQAIEKTADAKYRRTFHSDRGWGYQMKAYQHNLKCIIFSKVCLEKVIVSTIHQWKISLPS